MEEVRKIERDLFNNTSSQEEVKASKKSGKGKHPASNGTRGPAAEVHGLARQSQEQMLGKSSMAYCWHTSSPDGPRIHEGFWPHHYIDYFVGTSTGG